MSLLLLCCVFGVEPVEAVKPVSEPAAKWVVVDERGDDLVRNVPYGVHWARRIGDVWVVRHTYGHFSHRETAERVASFMNREKYGPFWYQGLSYREAEARGRALSDATWGD